MSMEEDEDLGMKIDSLNKELEISLLKSSFLEKESQELRRELAQLKSQIQSLMPQDDETMLAAVAGDDLLPEIPAAATYIPEMTSSHKLSKLVVVKENQRAAAPAPAPAPFQVRQVPELLELHSSLTKTDAEKSAHILKLKSKVENFINWLITKVNTATPKNITEVEKFVKWLDEEMALLVNEKAVLRHFPQWPESKVNALREAASTYRNLKNLENEVCLFIDNPKEEMNVALKKVHALQNRLEQSVSNMDRLRDCNNYKYFQIPYNWMLDSGLPTQMKLSSLRLAKEYIQMMTKELQSNETPRSDNFFLHGVRFAYRVHQYAGGFDSETIMAFEELKKVGLGSQRQL